MPISVDFKIEKIYNCNSLKSAIFSHSIFKATKRPPKYQSAALDPHIHKIKELELTINSAISNAISKARIAKTHH